MCYARTLDAPSSPYDITRYPPLCSGNYSIRTTDFYHRHTSEYS